MVRLGVSVRSKYECVERGGGGWQVIVRSKGRGRGWIPGRGGV